MRQYKKILLLFSVLFSAMHWLFASPINLKQAATIASNHLQRLSSLRGVEVKLVRTSAGNSIRGASSEVEYYIFETTRGRNGWVIVAGDDIVPPVLAYSTEGRFAQTLQPEFQSVLDKYAHLVQYAKANPTAPKLQLLLAPTEVVEPLMPKIQWDQAMPYNQNVPGLTGCVATALAQVMRYHAWPRKPQGKIEWRGKKIDFDIQPPYNWRAMIGNYTKGYTTEQGEAVARLMHDIGYAAKMKYKTTESSADPRDALQALRRNFNYAKTLRYYRTEYRDIAEWQLTLLEELKAKRPVPLDGIAMSYAAHEYVCDGYDGQGYFHINWGWSGANDGYFLLQSLEVGNGEPRQMTFNFVNAMLIGMQSPAKVPNVAELKEVCTSRQLEVNKGIFDKKKPLDITLTGIMNLALSPLVAKYAAVMQQIDEPKEKIYAHSEDKAILLCYEDEKFDKQIVHFNLGNCKPGRYVLLPAVYDTSTELYILAQQNNYTKKTITVDVTTDSYTVSQVEAKPELEFTITPTQVSTNELATFQLSIKNTGTQSYNRPIAALFSNSNNIPTLPDAKTLPFLSFMRIDPGTTETRTFSFKMPQGSEQYIHFFIQPSEQTFGKLANWFDGKHVYVPTVHHSAQKIVLSNNLPAAKYTIKQLSITERVKQAEHFKQIFSVEVASGDPAVILNLIGSLQKDGSPVDEVKIPTCIVGSGETKTFIIDRKMKEKPGSYQLFVYDNSLHLIPELLCDHIVVEANSNEIDIPIYDEIPVEPMALIHSPIIEKGEGMCEIFQIDTDFIPIASGAKIPKNSFLGVAPKPKIGYKIEKIEVIGAKYLTDDVYVSNFFTFRGKIFQIIDENVRIRIWYTPTNGISYWVHIPAKQEGGNCTIRKEGVPLTQDMEVEEGTILSITAEATKGYTLSQFIVSGAQRQGKSDEYKVTGEVRITITFTKNQDKTPPDTSNGIDKQTFADVRVIPNPFSTTLRISKYVQENEATYKLLNLMGNVLRKGKLESEFTDISTAELGTGVYFLQLQTKSAIRTVRVMKL
ncbi:MAG: C10 family peptidase [Bacteroides sp.]